MAFTSLLALVALATAASAAPASTTSTCPDGTVVSNEACCAFIPVSGHHTFAKSYADNSLLQLAQDLQSTLFMGDCGEDGKSRKHAIQRDTDCYF